MAGVIPRTIIQEVDGSPSAQFTTLKMPNGSLTDNGDGTVTYASSGGGDWTYIGNQSPTSGTATTFSSISASYKRFMLEIRIKDSTSANVTIQLNTLTSGIYSWYLFDGAAASQSSSTGDTAIKIGRVGGTGLLGGLAQYSVMISNVSGSNDPTLTWNGYGANAAGNGASVYYGGATTANNTLGVITDITVNVSAGAYAAQTTISLWGSTNT